MTRSRSYFLISTLGRYLVPDPGQSVVAIIPASLTVDHGRSEVHRDQEEVPELRRDLHAFPWAWPSP